MTVASSANSTDDSGSAGPRPQPVSSHQPIQALRGLRAVIVEDEGITQIQLKKICAHAGMVVVGTAANGAAGVEIVLATKPDLVLMDIKMPVMDGLQAAERILSQQSVCIVMLTAYNDDASRDRALALGAAGYVLKPVSSSDLLPQMETALRAFRSRPS